MQTAVAVASSHWSDLSARRGSTSPQCLHILYTIIHFVALTLSYKGRRHLNVLDFPVEWCNLEHTPLIQLHSFPNRSLPLISLFCQSVPKCRLPKNPASPRGKPRGRSHTLLPFIQPLSFVGFGRILSAPTVWVGKLLPFSEQLSCVHFGRLRASLQDSEAFGFLCVRYRAGSGTNVWVQSPCVTVRRHCRPPLQPQNVLQIISSCANY